MSWCNNWIVIMNLNCSFKSLMLTVDEVQFIMKAKQNKNTVSLDSK